MSGSPATGQDDTPVATPIVAVEGTTISTKVIFAAQIGIIYVVVIGSLINLSLEVGDSNLWVALLASSLGYILPAPSLRTPLKNG